MPFTNLPTLLLALATTTSPSPPADPPGEPTGTDPPGCPTSSGRAAAILAVAGDPGPESPPAAEIAPEVAAVLDAIDAQTLALREFQSPVRMDSYDDLADETERRFGRVLLRMPSPDDPDGGRIAAVVFERTVGPSGRSRERLEHYIYRDGVLSDYDHGAKRLVRRRLVADGDRRDPLRLGEGPVPIPIAQRKADILKSFVVTVAPPVPARVLPAAQAEGVRGIHLVPRPGTRLEEDGDITSIDLWVRGEIATPVAVEIHERSGDRTAVRFLRPVLNDGLGEDAERWLVPPPVDPTVWRIEEGR